MTFASHYHMSGTFHDGVHPGLFRPPVSPSSSTDYLSSSTYATESSKRKWSRSNGMQTGSFFEDVYMDSAPRNYALAGQLHSPVIGSNLDDADAAMGESMYSDSDYRRALGTKRSRDEGDDDSSGGPTPLFTQPEPEQSTQSGSWGSFAFSTIGGVVGRVWEFCKAGAFKGFYAGGGTSYKMTSAGVSVDETGSNSDQTGRRLHRQLPKRDHYSNNNQNAGYDSSYDSGASTPTGPAPKRRRHTENGGELGKNWVMIHEPEAETRTPRRMPSSALPSPRHRTQQTPVTDRRMSSASSFSTPTTSNAAPLRPASRAAGRPGSRMSDASSLRPLQSASAASFASFKAPSAPKPPTPSHTPSRIPQGRRRRHTVVPSSSDPSASSGHRRRGSIASVATSRVNEIDASPRLDAEARKLAARRQMEERDNDERMSAFNKQLQDMIRQGREALGTTIEVDGSWEDIS
ncbi:hypothetical protein M431DRAFT_91210 [Trichoderma harzianum CBS 226.95]|uniref:Uncharacterized protein n=1 Tax=Trichoderma harzianum CBS 226.95 TaxID=983964 RepID=A0A2T4A5F3_TRIHA|nr:hypothetical protein M431DRAFT_91210 [Trichoderma harzianum CBS 226.95]PTB52297.1 hypothetical protein M431DRAFT_91210 [Trichoderma harzianum CBS 226.95]